MDIGDSRALISERVTNLMQLQVVVVALLRRRWVCMRINMLFSQLLSIFPLSSSLPFSLQIWTPFFGPTILESRHRESLLSPCRNLLKSRALQYLIFCKWQGIQYRWPYLYQQMTESPSCFEGKPYPLFLGELPISTFSSLTNFPWVIQK